MTSPRTSLRYRAFAVALAILGICTIPGFAQSPDVVVQWKSGYIAGSTRFQARTSNGGSTGRKATDVRNGAVTNFERSIALEGDGHTAEDVSVAFSGAGLTLDGSGIRVERVHAVSNGGDGILCFGGGGHSVRHSEVNINNGIGINLAGCPGSSIIGNTVSVNTGDGIVAQCPSVVLQNMAFQNAGSDILADPVACTRSDNNPAP